MIMANLVVFSKPAINLIELTNIYTIIINKLTQKLADLDLLMDLVYQHTKTMLRNLTKRNETN